MLTITNLHVTVDEKPILNGINLTVAPGEVHAIMGPNGSGKSTLSSVIAGKAEYTVTEGDIQFNGQDLLSLTPDERATLGIFLGFQYPVEIPGVSTASFLRSAMNAHRKAQGGDPIDAMDFLALAKEKMDLLNMDQDFLYRALNEGFSGGEKKRNEVFQMMLLEPKLTILDEIDSGLDIDALQTVAKGVNAMRATDKSTIMVTHYQRLLEYVEPDVVHVFAQGKIVKSGDKTLAHHLEKEGYGWIEE
jgi:Fe-S cluster assembly ATP-binding protein